MKIFPKDSSSNSAPAARTSSSKADGPSRKKAVAPPKKELSPSEIKEKLAAHVETSDAAKNMAAAKNSKKLGENFMSDNIKPIVEEVKVETPKLEKAEKAEKVEEEIKTPNTPNLTIKSDIALNDPRDTNTQEKLKTVLTKGAFAFNPKERDALEKILAG